MLRPQYHVVPAAFCHVCQRETDTIYLRLRSGHVLNGCALCRTGRKHRPYISAREYVAITTNPAAGGKGVDHANLLPV
jgi:hypothetical protein